MAKIVLLLGPTAVGKTNLILELADRFCGVIYADMACLYRDLTIGTAKPSMAERQKLPHYMLDLLSLEQNFNAGDFYTHTQSICDQLTSQDKPILISGGTFFYTLNFLFGLSEAPASTLESRTYWQAQLAQRGVEDLHAELSRLDPLSAQRIRLHDSYRITRALEVFSDTGRRLSSYERPKVPRAEHDWLILALNRDRSQLYDRINARVDLMWEAGLATEVAHLIKEKNACAQTPAMKAIGYREFFLGLSHAQEIKEKIQLSTRHYAKRQITFLNQFPIDAMYHPDDVENIKKKIHLWQRKN